MNGVDPRIDHIAWEWRDRLRVGLEAALIPMVGRELRPVVLQSGGMDSLALTAALLSMGYEPLLVTFTIGGTEYADLRRVRLVANTFGLALRIVHIPRTEEQLVSDIRVAKQAGATLKTHIQCHQPVAHMARVIADECGPVEVVMGTGGICEDSRSCMVALGASGEEAARRIRRDTCVPGGKEGSATWFMHRALLDEGHTVIEPYTMPVLSKYALALNLAEINSPRQKGIALRAFPEFFRRCPVWAKNSSLQVGAGIRDWHDTLLQSAWNPDREFRNVVAIYNRMDNDVA